jgi:hypothetical protein
MCPVFIDDNTSLGLVLLIVVSLKRFGQFQVQAFAWRGLESPYKY